MEAPDCEVLSVREQLFHERIRECIISTLLFATLYILCHIFLTRFKKPAEFTTVDDADATVNKIAGSSCAPLPWQLPWVLSCSCPSPSSAMRCYSPCLGTTTSSGSTAPSSILLGVLSPLPLLMHLLPWGSATPGVYSTGSRPHVLRHWEAAGQAPVAGRPGGAAVLLSL
uniref:Limb development membrane protein 1 like n=1 Tax=Macaca fascicularis TaxID=9541 RepID=A0A2K5UTH2_MACFA